MAQVNGGRNLSAADKLMLDLWYIKHASLVLDAKIVWKTVVMLSRGETIDADAIAAARAEFDVARIWAASAAPDANDWHSQGQTRGTPAAAPFSRYTADDMPSQLQ